MSNKGQKGQIEKTALKCTLFTIIFVLLALGFGFGLGIDFINRITDDQTNSNENLNSATILDLDFEFFEGQNNTTSGSITAIENNKLTLADKYTVTVTDNTSIQRIDGSNLFNSEQAAEDITLDQLSTGYNVQITADEDIDVNETTEFDAIEISYIEF